MMWTEARRVHDANKWALSNEGHNYCRYDRHHILDILSNRQALRGQFSSRTKRDCRQPIAVSDISIYICLIDVRDGSGKPVYGGVDRLQALSSAKTGRRSCFFMN